MSGNAADAAAAAHSKKLWSRAELQRLLVAWRYALDTAPTARKRSNLPLIYDQFKALAATAPDAAPRRSRAAVGTKKTVLTQFVELVQEYNARFPQRTWFQLHEHERARLVQDAHKKIRAVNTPHAEIDEATFATIQELIHDEIMLDRAAKKAAILAANQSKERDDEDEPTAHPGRWQPDEVDRLLRAWGLVQEKYPLTPKQQRLSRFYAAYRSLSEQDESVARPIAAVQNKKKLIVRSHLFIAAYNQRHQRRQWFTISEREQVRALEKHRYTKLSGTMDEATFVAVGKLLANEAQLDEALVKQQQENDILNCNHSHWSSKEVQRLLVAWRYALGRLPKANRSGDKVRIAELMQNKLDALSVGADSTVPRSITAIRIKKSAVIRSFRFITEYNEKHPGKGWFTLGGEEQKIIAREHYKLDTKFTHMDESTYDVVKKLIEDETARQGARRRYRDARSQRRQSRVSSRQDRLNQDRIIVDHADAESSDDSDYETVYDVPSPGDVNQSEERGGELQLEQQAAALGSTPSDASESDNSASHDVVRNKKRKMSTVSDAEERPHRKLPKSRQSHGELPAVIQALERHVNQVAEMVCDLREEWLAGRDGGAAGEDRRLVMGQEMADHRSLARRHRRELRRLLRNAINPSQ
ncbi:hypothetical protein FI667_g17345, partial [Globisporangium splendens]